MAQHHKWGLAELEDLVPYERQIYLEMLIKYLRELEEQRARGGR